MTSNTLNQQALVVAFSPGTLDPSERTQDSLAKETPSYQPPSLALTYQTHFKFVWRCLKSLGVSDSSLDDAVQEVFLVVQDKLANFDGACELRTWLYAIVLRIGRRYRASAALHAKRFEASCGSGRADSVLTDSTRADSARTEPGSAESTLLLNDPRTADLRREVEAHDQLRLARRALEYLDDAKREAFVLSFVEGMSGPEIAQITQVPLNTIYSRLRAAKQEFSAALAELQQSTADRPTSHESHLARNQT